MGLKRLNELIDNTNKAMGAMMATCSYADILDAWKAYRELRTEIRKFTSFVEHDWMVKLYTKDSYAEVKIKAEHIGEARDTAVELMDALWNVVRYELYCDGILLAEHE